MRITHYGFARNAQDKVEQVLVGREGEPGKMRQISQRWTGVLYGDERRAMADMARLNCGGAR